MASTKEEPFRLKLDPKIEAEIRVLEIQAQNGRLRRVCLTPNWRLFEQTSLNRLLLAPPVAAPPKPLVPKGKGPSQPRAGKTSDVMKAVWKIPAVQSVTNRVVDQVTGKLKRDWRRLSAADKGLVISYSVVFGASALGMVYRDDETRQVLKLIENTDIPIPATNGLKIRLAPTGAGVHVPVPGVSGLSARGSFKVNEPLRTRRVDYKVTVSFDIAEYLRSR